jgi:hypothetical protein
MRQAYRRRSKSRNETCRASGRSLISNWRTHRRHKPQRKSSQHWRPLSTLRTARERGSHRQSERPACRRPVRSPRTCVGKARSQLLKNLRGDSPNSSHRVGADGMLSIAIKLDTCVFTPPLKYLKRRDREAIASYKQRSLTTHIRWARTTGKWPIKWERHGAW